MNILKLTFSDSSGTVRINACAIVSYYRVHSECGDYTAVTTKGYIGEGGYTSIWVKESPEQIDKILLEMGVKICP